MTRFTARPFGSCRRLVPLAALGVWAILGCASAPPQVGPLPPAPAHLEHSLRLILLAEEKIEHAEWAEAAGITEAARAELSRIEPQLREVAGRRPVGEALAELDRLGEAVAARDQEEAMAAYARAEQRLFAIVDRFSYPVHPVFAIMDADAQESLERVRAGDFRHAAVELEEVAAYFEAARRTETGRRLPPATLEELGAAIGRAREAVESRDARAAEGALGALTARTERLLHP